MSVAATPTHNHWPDAKCAKAFWSQQEVRPYQQLLRDTLDWANPQPDDVWLDLGCGSGAITRGLWQRSQGKLSHIIGTDVATINKFAYDQLQRQLTPEDHRRIRFVCHNFSEGLQPFDDAVFDNVVSGLSISYAEHFDEETQSWTTHAYDRLMHEVARVLKPGGWFIFSVNVPNPNWNRVAIGSLTSLWSIGRPIRFIRRSLRMLKYGKWLKQEAERGRFHYLPADEVTRRLKDAGFTAIQHRLSYCKQAYIFQAMRNH